MNNLPVMVWFHGGGWVSGAGTSQFYGPTFLMDHDIVLVTVNYRLGPLGFMSTGDEAAPGNFGLKDQVAALRWTRDNIAAFGGDPGSVTIFGESAGGASVHYHMLSPLSRGLFHRGISQSGNALNMWTLAPNGDSRHQAEKLARFLSCPTAPSADLVSCLREKPAADVIATDRQFMEWDVDPLIPFKPVIEQQAAGGEEVFLPDHPLSLLLDRRVSNTSWITGLNSGDGGLRAAPIYASQELVAQLNNNFDHVAPISMFYGQTSPKVDEVSQKIRKFYFGNNPINNDTVFSVVDMFTDSWFLHGTNQAVRLQATRSSAPVYYYYFAYRGTRSFSELFSGLDTDFGVCHADELQYLFPSNRVFPDLVPSDEDNRITDILLTMWTNFARTGKPTTERLNVSFEWKPVTTSALEYLHIGSEMFMSTELLKERAEFWASLPVSQHHSWSNLAKDEL
ncbi:venom carboxylesterase-6-like [Bacillus rossius redtenbacheri]|uniref:venom carboxylesterase-6-like n=1 Tax=Bacillus rossius redtenbacheri TaxID=93214 RepID=UPI002FDE2373